MSRQPRVITDRGFAVRIGIVAGVFALGASLAVIAMGFDTEEITFPAEVEQVFPAPGSLAIPQAAIGVDLDDAYTGVLILDGVELPEDQYVRIKELGQVQWMPGEGQEQRELDAIEHTVTVAYWRTIESRETGTKRFTWRFQTKA
jgi:hypothetical protein